MSESNVKEIVRLINGCNCRNESCFITLSGSEWQPLKPIQIPEKRDRSQFHHIVITSELRFVHGMLYHRPQNRLTPLQSDLRFLHAQNLQYKYEDISFCTCRKPQLYCLQ